MSSLLFRRGGISMGTMLILKKRSSLNCLFFTRAWISRFDATTILTSIFLVTVSPTRLTFSLSRKWSNFTWRSCGISVISSKNSVPLSAISNIPGFPSLFAPVNAPLTYPNSSLSRSVAGIAPQFTWINGPFRLSEYSCIKRAIRLLPTPDSPWRKTVTPTSETFRTIS